MGLVAIKLISTCSSSTEYSHAQYSLAVLQYTLKC
jgi:hypothetical protein